jgi:hypothetical protein
MLTTFQCCGLNMVHGTLKRYSVCMMTHGRCPETLREGYDSGNDASTRSLLDEVVFLCITDVMDIPPWWWHSTPHGTFHCAGLKHWKSYMISLEWTLSTADSLLWCGLSIVHRHGFLMGRSLGILFRLCDVTRLKEHGTLWMLSSRRMTTSCFLWLRCMMPA